MAGHVTQGKAKENTGLSKEPLTGRERDMGKREKERREGETEA
jgi:hypothetical protein